MKTIWEDVQFPPRERLIGRDVADCTVIGAGMAGLMVAWELQQRGFGVVVLEASRICSGATMRTTAKITAQHGLIYDKLIRQQGEDIAKLYYESNIRAIDKYEKIVREKAIDCDFKRFPSYLYGKKSVFDIVRETAAAEKINAKCAFTQDTGLPYSVKGALRFNDQAQFHPLKFLRSIAKDLIIYENTPVIDIEDGKVSTALGEVTTHYIINTTHYPIINLPGLYFMRQHQERSYAMAVRTDEELDGMYYGVDDDRSLRSFRGGVIIGGEKHRTGNNQKGGCLCKLKDFAKSCYPEAEVLCMWSNQDAMPHDSVPFIGRYSRFTPRMFVATGFSKWGMSLSAVASELIADLICGKSNDYEKLYTPSRVRLKAAAGSFAVDVGYSVRGLCAGLAGKKEQRCTHLGGRLHKNADEGTWECPLHGSQFDSQGHVIFSPAQENIPEN